VKDVYDFRLQKYQEWMDNLEGIVSKVMAPNVQYTYKEFKIIQDSLTSLTRDLDKEGMKDWLDMMLEKVSMRVAADEGAASSKDKEFKANEKKKLQALIDRHNGLMPPTQETQAKVEIYARCYAYGDDISSCLKTLEEMRHLSIKEIHPHNMNMVEEQIEKADKVINTVEAQRETYEELLKRGKKLNLNPNKAPFLTDLLEKMENTWKDASEQSKARHAMLCNSAKDWEKYDECRASINAPMEKIENEMKRYRKFYDPVIGLKKLNQKKAIWDVEKKNSDEILGTMKKCYATIMVLAGDDKKEFLDKEVAEVEEKASILDKAKEKWDQLWDFNDKLAKAVGHSTELKEFCEPVNAMLTRITTEPDMSPEERVKEVLILQEQCTIRFPEVEPLDKDFHDLIHEDDLEKSETAKNTMAAWDDNKLYITEVCEAVEKEAGSISADQRLYADYLYGVKDIKPWVDSAEATVKQALPKPVSLAEVVAMLDTVKAFDGVCAENKTKLEDAGKARASMEKPSSTLNEVEPLTERWDSVKKVAVQRIEHVTALMTTWQDLTDTTATLTAKMAEVPILEEPNLEELEKIFASVKELQAKKKELVVTI